MRLFFCQIMVRFSAIGISEISSGDISGWAAAVPPKWVVIDMRTDEPPLRNSRRSIGFPAPENKSRR